MMRVKRVARDIVGINRIVPGTQPNPGRTAQFLIFLYYDVVIWLRPVQFTTKTNNKLNKNFEQCLLVNQIIYRVLNISLLD
jgi:hypothetical protein